jgi:hypothetical protein
MFEMEGSLALCAPEEDIINVVDASHVNMGNRVGTPIRHTLLLLLFGSEALSQWL